MNYSQNFSSCQREALFDILQTEILDVLIIGGGITGAGIALDAASRGLKVGLIEQRDFSSGTSSRSTKLVHGGLRYLEQLQFAFVADLGRERKILHDNATHNVLPTPVLLPIIKGGQLKKGLTFLALKLYDFLAGVKKEYQARWISKKEMVDRYPFLRQEGLKGAYLYYEYKTNDGRLVIETLKKAVELGAVALNYTEPVLLTHHEGKVNGATVKDSISGRELQVKAKAVINATGPWCELFMKEFDTGMEKSLYPTKGIHLVFLRTRFPLKEAFYFDTHDNRMVFAIPRKNHVYVGTTDTPFTGDLHHPRVGEPDINYLLEVVNYKFEGLHLTRKDVVSCWAGVRPLIKSKSSTPGEVSRREELFISPGGLITITGGKLTGFRLMAKKVVDLVMKNTNQPFIPCRTKTIRASGSNWKTPPSMNELVEYADQKYDEAKQTGIDSQYFKTLFYRYGTNIDQLTELAYFERNRITEAKQIWLKAEITYAITREMVATLSDFFIYRTEMVLFEPTFVEEVKHETARIMGEILGWSDEERLQQISLFEEHWNEYRI